MSLMRLILPRDVAIKIKLLIDAAGRLAPLLPDQHRVELDMAGHSRRQAGLSSMV